MTAEPKDRRGPVEPVKALTVRQPWATLLCDPTLPKWIETRSRRTNIRGRIGIIAGKHRPPGFWLNDWQDEAPPEPFASLGFDLDRFFDPYESSDGNGYWRYDYRWSRFRFGYLIGTVDLYDCVPIVPCRSEGGRPTPEQLIVYPDMLRIVRRQPSNPPFASGGYDIEVCDDQRPYGDFTPGGWAWLTRDAVLLDEPIPMRGSLGWQTVAFRDQLAEERAA